MDVFLCRCLNTVLRPLTARRRRRPPPPPTSNVPLAGGGVSIGGGVGRRGHRGGRPSTHVSTHAVSHVSHTGTYHDMLSCGCAVFYPILRIE